MIKAVVLFLSLFVFSSANENEIYKNIKKEPRKVFVKNDVKLDPKKKKVVVLAVDENLVKGYDNGTYEKRLKVDRKNLMKRYGIIGDSLGPRSFKAQLDDVTVQRLRNNYLVSEIYDEVEGKWGGSSEVIELSPNFGVLTTYPGSVNAAHFTNLGYMGQTVNVGVNGMNPIDPYYINGFLNFPGFSVRPYTKAQPITDHEMDVVSIIKNTNEHNSFFQGGGSPSINSVSLGYMVNDETTLLGAYDWNASRGNHIVNNSFKYTDLSTGNNLHSRYTDIQSASWPYILYVFSAGNDNGVVYNKCHNCVLVGSVNDTPAKSSFSSWTNPTGDEVPHVMAKGEHVLLHSTSTYKSGTSFAAPVIAALAADAYSIFSHYKSYPEVFKCALMNSCDRLGDYNQDYVDEKNGMGIPNGEILYKISENRYRNSHSTYNTDRGVADFLFYENQSNNYYVDKILNVPQVSTPRDIQFTMTFLSNPEGTCTPGNECVWDDVDIFVYDMNGNVLGQSTSSYNTTEVIKFQHTGNGGGSKSYKIRLYLYNRYTNKVIYGAVSWRLI